MVKSSVFLPGVDENNLETISYGNLEKAKTKRCKNIAEVISFLGNLNYEEKTFKDIELSKLWNIFKKISKYIDKNKDDRNDTPNKHLSVGFAVNALTVDEFAQMKKWLSMPDLQELMIRYLIIHRDKLWPALFDDGKPYISMILEMFKAEERF